MRVAVVSESFLPTVNGVTTSVCRVLDHLAARGHDALVIVPSAGAPASYAGFPVHAVPSVAYRQFPVGLPAPAVHRLLADFAPDVLHAASPFLLGTQAIASANRLGVPSVAVFQTDVAGYARRNRLGSATRLAWRFVRWVHDGATLTLAPSRSSLDDLERAGVQRVEHWPRGVDLACFHPRARSTPAARALRARLSPDGEVVLGYVGRVAPEKQVERLAALRDVPGTALAVVGDGPSLPSVRRSLRAQRPHFLGRLGGEDLAAAYSALDVFVHTGTEETFGQTLQEAHASGLPVVAPAVGGPLDLVDHGVDGLLYDPDDPRSLREAVAVLTSDRGMRNRFGEAGRRRVLTRSWESVCDSLLARYDGVLTPSPSTSAVS